MPRTSRGGFVDHVLQQGQWPQRRLPPGDTLLPVAEAITGHAVGAGLNRRQNAATAATVRASEILPAGDTEERADR